MTINNHKATLASLLCALGLSLLPHCSSTSVTGGASGTEVSACVGSVIDVNGYPVEHALVRLRPITFLSDSGLSEAYCATHSVMDTVTGSNGVYGFTNIIPDSYLIEVTFNDTTNYDTLGSLTQLTVGQNDPLWEIQPLVIVPMASVSGKVQIEYSQDASIFIQTFGLDRSAKIDEDGNFSIRVPRGELELHIAAYHHDDTARLKEFDGIDVTLNVVPGEIRDAGSFSLRSAPPPPCKDGTCDTSVVRALLMASGNQDVPLDAVVKFNKGGRIVGLDCRGLDFSNGISEDIVQLSELRLLNLDSTGLPVMFPEIGRLMRLEIVHLGGNKLSFFSSTIGSLKNLRELDLSNNELTDLPSSITNCLNLSDINISGNRLCTIEPAIASWLESRVPDWRNSQLCE